MADPPVIDVVPDPQTTDFGIPDIPVRNPFNSIWWVEQTATGVPESVMGWLVAQGWRITAAEKDSTTNPPTVYYDLITNQLTPLETISSLCNSWVYAAEEAKQTNNFRYNSVVSDWTRLVDSSHYYFKEQTEENNAAVGVYIADLETAMAEVDELSKDNIDRLERELSQHEDDSRELLTNLGITEERRIEEEYEARLSVSLQDLIDRGNYNDIAYVDIRTRNHRDRDEQIQMLNDRLMREKLVNEHQLYGQQENLTDHRHRRIVERMNSAAARLEGWRSVNADNQKLMAYQLDERNKLVIGLYSFVERREDIAPEWRDMAQMIAGLGDSAGGWITP